MSYFQMTNLVISHLNHSVTCYIKFLEQIKKPLFKKALRMREKDLAKLEPTFRQIGGYINYEDYMFLLMMLTTPRRNFEIAFRMFDLDGNGVVDAQEFAQVTETIMRGEKISDRLQNL